MDKHTRSAGVVCIVMYHLPQQHSCYMSLIRIAYNNEGQRHLQKKKKGKWYVILGI